MSESKRCLSRSVSFIFTYSLSKIIIISEILGTGSNLGLACPFRAYGVEKRLGRTGEQGIWAGEFSYPTDVAVGRDERFPASFGSKGDGPGRFNFAIAVAVADDGAVFVADFGNNRVQVWRPKR